MSNPLEKPYQPSDEEIKETEDMMTSEQRELSKEKLMKFRQEIQSILEKCENYAKEFKEVMKESGQTPSDESIEMLKTMVKDMDKFLEK